MQASFGPSKFRCEDHQPEDDERYAWTGEHKEHEAREESDATCQGDKKPADRMRQAPPWEGWRFH
jgi:hypothetical protein